MHGLLGLNYSCWLRHVRRELSDSFFIQLLGVLGRASVYGKRFTSNEINGQRREVACDGNRPVGIATQDKLRQKAIHVGDKSDRVARFHRNTMKALGEIAGAAGLNNPSDFMPYHFMFRQKDNEFLDGNEAYPYLPEGFLLAEEEIESLADWHSRWDRASADTFAPPEIPHGPFTARKRVA